MLIYYARPQTLIFSVIEFFLYLLVHVFTIIVNIPGGIDFLLVLSRKASHKMMTTLKCPNDRMNGITLLSFHIVHPPIGLMHSN